MAVSATPQRASRTASSRDRALTAARAAILDGGATRTTMVEIARRSGVGRTSLYRYWPDVTALFADLLTRELTAIVARVDPALLDPALPVRALADPARPSAAPRNADELARLLCTLADEVRVDPLVDALRRHEPDLIAEYLLHRLGTSQRRLIGLMRDLLAQAIDADPRLVGRDPGRTATMLFLAVQGVVLSAPLADPPLDPDAWRTELHLLIKGYLGL